MIRDHPSAPRPVERNRATEIDAVYAAYDRVPPEAEDAWWGSGGVSRPRSGDGPSSLLSRDAAISRLRRTLVGPCTTTVRGIPRELPLERVSDERMPRSARRSRSPPAGCDG
jgi:hypothetical protein